MCLGTFFACGELRKRHLLFRRSAILAERFCVIVDKVSYDTKKAAGIVIFDVPAARKCRQVTLPTNIMILFYCITLIVPETCRIGVL